MGVKQPLSSQRKELLKELIDGLERNVQSLCDRLVREVTIDRVETVAFVMPSVDVRETAPGMFATE